MGDEERAQVLSRLDRIKVLIADLEWAQLADDCRTLLERLTREVEGARMAIDPVITFDSRESRWAGLRTYNRANRRGVE